MQLPLEKIPDHLRQYFKPPKNNPGCGSCFICHMRTVFAEVWRVLRPDGVLFLNMGDTYNSNPSWGRGQSTLEGRPQDQMPAKPTAGWLHHARTASLKSKDLCGLPSRLALALQADGWTWRSDIIWSKPSCMPESVQDRPTRAHEYILLFSKQAQYFYDAPAIAEEAVMRPQRRLTPQARAEDRSALDAWKEPRILREQPAPDSLTRNSRTIWTIPSEPFSGAHFACFPTELARRCILAGTSAHGVCSACGAPWTRMSDVIVSWRDTAFVSDSQTYQHGSGDRRARVHSGGMSRSLKSDCGWRPSCRCDAAVTPAIVLDPFCGSGTTLLAARMLGRHGIGCDLSWPYLHAIARERLHLTALAAWEGRNGHVPTTIVNDLPLFGGTTS